MLSFPFINPFHHRVPKTKDGKIGGEVLYTYVIKTTTGLTASADASGGNFRKI